ncbi:unnamed protein product [Acanthoscelides obtectus]|uniref:Uncharacterized protein n=1 Tax=Acanthoscelides obtectus TaxID=200917 RepID=A0A9P0NXJ2_ACAOB|nr:unnamed protein product [Acanthoscelides obtectus]CAK1640278.1 hypothetical protein AOBTE_LOCUS11635 [Acanthoscelides obtectus]
MKYLRRVKEVTKMDKIRNESIRTELETESILEHIEMKQLRWWEQHTGGTSSGEYGARKKEKGQATKNM